MNNYIRIILFAFISAAVFYSLAYFLKISILSFIGSACVIVGAMVLLAWVFTLLFPNAAKKNNDNE